MAVVPTFPRPASLFAVLLFAVSCASPAAPQFEGALAAPVAGFTGRPFGIAVSAQGRVFVTQQDANSVARFRVGDRRLSTPVAVTTDPGDVIFTADGAQAIVSTFYGGRLHILDAATGEEADVVTIGANAYRLALAADDARIFVTTVTGMLYAVDRADAAVVDSVELSGSLQAIARRPGTSTLVVANTAGTLWRIDAATLDIVGDASHPAMIQDVAFSPDGEELYVASESPGWVAVLDGQSLARVDSIGFPAAQGFQPFGLAVSPDGEHLLVTSPASGRVALVDVASRAILQSFVSGGTPRRAAFAPTGRRAYVANEHDRVEVVR